MQIHLDHGQGGLANFCMGKAWVGYLWDHGRTSVDLGKGAKGSPTTCRVEVI